MSRTEVLRFCIMLSGVFLSAQLPLYSIELPTDYDYIRVDTQNLEKSARPQSKSDSTLNIYVRDAGYKWISCQMKINLKTSDEELAFQCFFVNRIDSLIYLNLHKSGIELARVVLTPDSVIYVNKLEKEYYRGKYDFLHKIMGFPLDFQMIQALLNGCDFPNFEPIRYQTEEEGYERYISSLRMRNDASCSLMQEIDVVPFTKQIAKNDITDLKTLRDVVVTYNGYAPVAEGGSADSLFFTVLDAMIEDEGVHLHADLKNVRLNIPGPTSIKIPHIFSEIEINDKK